MEARVHAHLGNARDCRRVLEAAAQAFPTDDQVRQALGSLVEEAVA
ncbi:MAG: tetratricopeptide repeat protein [Chloroflexota bacterium]